MCSLEIVKTMVELKTSLLCTYGNEYRFVFLLRHFMLSFIWYFGAFFFFLLFFFIITFIFFKT